MPEVDIKVVNDTLSPTLKKLLQDSGKLSKNVLKAMGGLPAKPSCAKFCRSVKAH